MRKTYALDEKAVRWAYKWWCYGASYEQLANALFVDPRTVERAFKRRGLKRIRAKLIYYGKE